MSEDRNSIDDLAARALARLPGDFMNDVELGPHRVALARRLAALHVLLAEGNLAALELEGERFESRVELFEVLVPYMAGHTEGENEWIPLLARVTDDDKARIEGILGSRTIAELLRD